MSISERLKIILSSKNIKPIDLSRITGKSKGYVSNLLNGVNENPTSEFLLALKEVFSDLDINWLLTGKGSMFIRQIPDLSVQYNPDAEEKLKSIGERIAYIQDINNINLADFAKMLDVDKTRIAQIMEGYRDIDPKTLGILIVNLKKNFNIDIDWLIFGEGATKEIPAEKTDTQKQINEQKQEILELKNMVQKIISKL